VPVIVAGALSLTDKEVDKLNGPVKSVTVKFAKYNLDKSHFLQAGRSIYVESPAELKEITKYNREGNKIEWATYLSGIPTKFIHEYNQQGIVIRSVLIYPDGKEKVKNLTEIEGINLKIQGRKFDQTERVTVTTITGKGLVNEKTYDSYGNLTEEIVNLPINSPEGDGPEKHIYTYDRDGNEIERNVYKNGKLTYACRYTYDLDQWKNWTKKKETFYSSEYGDFGFTPSSITYREISYYDD
jgi:hypothetical protein